MNKVSKLLFLAGLYFLSSTDVLPSEWAIDLYPVSSPSKSIIEIGKGFVNIEFVGDNFDSREMYNPSVEIFLPDVLDYDKVVPYGAQRKKGSVRWDNIEQYIRGMSKGEPLPRLRGWACIVKVRGVKPGRGDVTAKLTWEDKGGKKYEREFLLKTVVVTGKPEDHTELLPVVKKKSRKRLIIASVFGAIVAVIIVYRLVK